MNNQTYTNSTETELQDYNAQAVAGIISFIVLALTISVAIALLVASQQRKPKTFREKLEYNLGKSSEATAQAFKQLSKDINELRKSIEDRIESRR
jgi:beta-lactamase regulating signal transducer with metallopeptidase domain